MSLDPKNLSISNFIEGWCFLTRIVRVAWMRHNTGKLNYGEVMRGILLLVLFVSLNVNAKLRFARDTDLRDNILQLYIRNHIIFACPNLFENQGLEVESRGHHLRRRPL